jgi:HAD superfamily hydrolase (TIGR01484 family)
LHYIPLVRYQALAVDYDGTIARHGIVDAATLTALNDLKATGRKLLLVTGRELHDLGLTFEHFDIFDRIVAENGAVLYRPATKDEKLLCAPACGALADALREKGIKPLSVGRAIVATAEPNDGIVLQLIRQLGVELQVIFNKGAVMVLPSGVNKATGLLAALEELGLSSHNVIGIGDAENDHAFLELCECAVATANAVPALKERADWVTQNTHGVGVAEIVRNLVKDDWSEIDQRLSRYRIPIGVLRNEEEVSIPPYGCTVLVAGTSGGGKSTLVTGFLERLIGKQYQAFVLDPEGDYPELAGSIVLGDAKRIPKPAELSQALQNPRQNVVANIIGIKLEDRPIHFTQILLELVELRSRTARPHWVIVDEAHHVLPATRHASLKFDPAQLKQFLLVTLTPEHLPKEVLHAVDLLIALGEHPDQTIGAFCDMTGERRPSVTTEALEAGDAILWRRGSRTVTRFRVLPTKMVRQRHIRKYMKGELGEDSCFYFEGPLRKLHLRAQNLEIFLQLADGVDDETWLYHLRRHDYSNWFRDFIKDEELAEEVRKIEQAGELSAAESRARIREQIESRYTAAA